MNAIKESSVLDENSVTEINKITGKLVKKACVKMKPNKMDVSRGYSSDTFLKIGFENVYCVFCLGTFIICAQRFRDKISC